ncbi:astacin-like metalloprotease toxin 5 [Parasteatoda tepidariorum]|uniref:astacin-like metalloprotease toxin 5 n=1 Tax=Parasteatoda tepidariorum TaxID=114398 RepID=UPI0039BD7265
MPAKMIVIIFILILGYSSAYPANYYDAMENPDLFGGDMIVSDIQDRNAVVNAKNLWPGGIIPYVLDPGVDKIMKFLLTRAFNHYKKFTCIQFKPREEETDYIRIFPGKGCFAQVGKSGGSQPVSLGDNCAFEGVVIHELGHAIGFYHEQNRSDRDDFIKIYWENIKEGSEFQFKKLMPHLNQLLTPFDYNSIMLYGSYTFSKDARGKLRTMEALDGSLLQEPLLKGKLSQRDIERIKKLYKCP